MKTLLKIVVPLLLLAGGVLLARLLSSLAPEVESVPPVVRPPAVEVTTAVREDIQLSVYAQGTVVPRTQSLLTAEVAGRIEEVSHALVAGGFFERGDVLVRIEEIDYELAVDEARLAVAQAERNVLQAEADADVARRDWDTYEEGEAPPLVLKVPQLAEARASLSASRSRLERAQRDVQRCVVRAPYPGRVRSKAVDVGQFVARGAELARVYAIDWAEVRLPLPDAQLAHLDLPLAYRGDAEDAHGPLVELSARFGGRDHVWRGRVVRTEGELDPESRMVVAVARVEDPYGRGEDLGRPPLAIGMFVDAVITGRVESDCSSLPRTALRGGKRVYVLVDEARLAIREVEVLKAERDRVIVRAGVEAGEQVILSPLETAVEGMRVRVTAQD